jgi:ATP-binding cassette subfamily C protein
VNPFSIRRFASMLLAAAPRAMAASLVLMILVALTEGAGLFLLFPLLALAGVTTGAPAADGMWAKLAPYVPHSLGGALLLYVSVVAARAALELAESVASVHVQAEVTRTLRERLYRALVRARWETVAPLRGARLAHVLTAELERVSLTMNQLLDGSLQLLVALVYGAAALAISPALALIAAAGALLLLVPARRQQRASRRAGETLTELGAELFAGATEEVATLKVAKSAGIADRMADRFSQRARRHALALLSAHRRYRASGALLTAGAAAALAIVVYVAVARLHLAPASLLLLLLVCGRLVPRIASVQSSFPLTARALPAAEAVQALLDELEGAAEAREGGHVAPIAITRAIQLRGVTYRYPGARTPALRDVSLSIPAGQVTALVGSSSAGKSTIADVVLLLLIPESGELAVDDLPLSERRRDAWRASVGYVPQETHLFHDSIRENVRWVVPEASDERTGSRERARDSSDHRVAHARGDGTHHHPPSHQRMAGRPRGRARPWIRRRCGPLGVSDRWSRFAARQTLDGTARYG